VTAAEAAVLRELRRGACIAGRATDPATGTVHAATVARLVARYLAVRIDRGDSYRPVYTLTAAGVAALSALGARS
jgi:hypothetical protein